MPMLVQWKLIVKIQIQIVIYHSMLYVKQFFIYSFIDIMKLLDYLMVKRKFLFSDCFVCFRNRNSISMAIRSYYFFRIKSIEILFTSDYSSICSISKVRYRKRMRFFMKIFYSIEIIKLFSVIQLSKPTIAIPCLNHLLSMILITNIRLLSHLIFSTPIFHSILSY
jgi:hypothetical protein